MLWRLRRLPCPPRKKTGENCQAPKPRTPCFLRWRFSLCCLRPCLPPKVRATLERTTCLHRTWCKSRASHPARCGAYGLLPPTRCPWIPLIALVRGQGAGGLAIDIVSPFSSRVWHGRVVRSRSESSLCQAPVVQAVFPDVGYPAYSPAEQYAIPRFGPHEVTIPGYLT